MAIEKLQRVFGLDLLRSAAIIIVTISHSNALLWDHLPKFPYLPLPDGVDLFFVLSGFLIGSILIRSVEQQNELNRQLLSVFLQRRWLRTLPNYFLFLGINIVLIHFGLIYGTLNKYLITYFVFFQNLYKPYDFLFWESWSLAVEEWFYLLFPLLLFILFNFFRNVKLKHLIFFSILVFLIVPIMCRLANSGMELSDLYIRKLVITRLDCIAYGLLAAFLKFYYSAWWARYQKHFFFAGIFLLGLLVTNDNSTASIFTNVWYFSLIGLAIMLLLPLLDHMKTEPFRFKPFEFISRISYSMYLVQIPLFQLFIKFFSAESLPVSLLRYLLYWLVLIVFSALIHNYFEKPFLRLRKQ